MYQQDYILRMVERLAAAIARAVGLSREEPEQALQAIEAARAALPFVPGLIENSNAREIAEFAPSPRIVLQLAHLERLEGLIREARGENEVSVLRCFRRASGLFVEAARQGATSNEDREAFRPLLERLTSASRIPSGDPSSPSGRKTLN